MKTLFVIEANGKAQTLTDLLKYGGYPHVVPPALVLPTKGHLAHLAPGTSGLDSLDRMSTRVTDPSRRTEVAAIRRAALAADVIIIATDDDDEGDVIARDVATAAFEPGRSFWRCRLRTLDREQLTEALRQSTRQTASEANDSAVRGDVRRLVDFGIGFGLTKAMGNRRIPVGRVLSSGLIGFAECPAALGQQTFSAPALHGGEAFTATVNGVGIVRHRPLPPLPVAKVFQGVGAAAWDYVTATSAIALQTQKSVREVSASLQRCYEQGAVSYPRTLSTAMSSSGLDACRAIANRHGSTFVAARIASSLRGAHEAIRPTARANLQRALLHDLDATSALLVARQAIRAGQNYLIEIPDHSLLPQEILDTGARFARVSVQGFLGWKDAKKPIRSPWYQWPSDVALLEVLAGRGLGRPSTWSKHIDRLLQPGMLTPSLNLGTVGAVYANVAVEQGISAQTSQSVETQIAGLRPHPDAEAGPIALGILHSVLPSGSFSLAHKALRTPVEAEATSSVDQPDFAKDDDSFEPW